MQLPYGIEFFVQTRGRASAAELVEVGRHAALAIGSGGTVRVNEEYAGTLIPFFFRIAAKRRVVNAIDVECLGAYVFHWRAQYAAIAAVVIARGLVHQVAKGS